MTIMIQNVVLFCNLSVVVFYKTHFRDPDITASFHACYHQRCGETAGVVFQLSRAPGPKQIHD